MSMARRRKQISTAVLLAFSFSLTFPLDAAAVSSRQRSPARRISAPKATFMYVVRRGDTLYSIGRRYGTTVDRLMATNGLRSDRLRVGQRLVIRSRAASQSTSRLRPMAPAVTMTLPPPPPVPVTTVGRMPELVVGGEVLAPKPMRVRRGPREFYATLAIVAPETRLLLLSEENGWYEVQLPGGEVGYVFVDDFKVDVQVPGQTLAPEVHGNDIVREAVRYLGIRYVWGGTSADGMDCSGFIYLVFAARVPGLERLRSYDYYRMGVAVDRGSLLPGDLVFFTTYARGPSHVGIFAGDGKFIHASSGAGVVTMTSLDEPYYTARYVGARRLVKP